MPATEQTWRDSKKMHVIFGISSVLMLLTTIWMLAADHHREWKHYQQTFRDVESRSIEYRIQQQDNEQFAKELAARKERLAAAQREVPPAHLIEDFHQIIIEEAKGRDVPAEDY